MILILVKNILDVKFEKSRTNSSAMKSSANLI